MAQTAAQRRLPPELSPRARRPPPLSGLRRLLTLAATALSGLVLIGSVGGYVVVHVFNGSIGRVHLSLGGHRSPSAHGSQNWLLVGTDSRAGTGNQFGGNEVQGQRSDTTIVAHLASDGSSTFVSIPRDTLVAIPAYDDGNGRHQPARMDKFNSAILTGGPSLLVRTVEGLTGIQIDHYVSVDLAGFKQISDAVGGVDVCLNPSNYAETGTDDAGHTYRSTNTADIYSGWHGQVGVQTVQGDQALAFVRQRHGLPGGDIARIQRQQQFLGAVFRKASSTGVLLNPTRLAPLLGAVSGALTLDQHTSVTDLRRLATRLKGVGASRLQFATLPTHQLSDGDAALGHIFTGPAGVPELVPAGQPTSIGNVQIPDQPGFQSLLDQLHDRVAGPPPSSAGATGSGAVTVPPSQIVVTVRNGSPTQGVARRVRAGLLAAGFRTTQPTVADRNDYVTQEVHYPPGAEEQARTVQAAVGGAVLVPDPAVAVGVDLIVGSAPVNVVPVHPATPAPAAPASANPQAPPPSTADPHCTF